MIYAFSCEVPATAGIYARIKDAIGPERPPDHESGEAASAVSAGPVSRCTVHSSMA